MTIASKTELARLYVSLYKRISTSHSAHMPAETESARRFRPFDAPPYVAQLDGLRAVAVLLVLAEHFPYVHGSALSASWRVVQACHPGHFGVDLFFVLSGFLITRILVRERARTGAISFSEFYARRALRIFPIYYLCVAVVILAFPTAPGARTSLLLYIFNYYHLLNPAPYPLEQT